MNGEVVEYARRPPAVATVRDAFAVYIFGESMAPRYEHGDLVVVHPGRPARPGDDVVVELAPGPDDQAGAAFVKRLVKQDEREVVVRQYNPEKTIRFSRGTVKAVHRILRDVELLAT